jgi:HAE1 family hydrophobic/amphiphilic exporter-1
MNKLARFSVRYPTTVAMAVLAVLLLGFISYKRLGMDLLPRLASPRLYIDVQAGERPPEEMEKQYVEKIEALAARGRNVTGVLSLSRVGKALITVEYQWTADMDEAYLDLQKAVAGVGQGGGIDEINVTQLDPNAQAVITAVLVHEESSDLDLLRQTAENVIRNELIRLPGVAAVELVGDRRREIEILSDAFTLEAFGLTQDQLSSTIQNFNRNLSGGSIVEMGIRYTIRGVGELDSLEDIRNLIVAYKTETVPAGEPALRTPVYLRDIAEVRLALSEPENVVRYNGTPCIALEIFKEAGSNTTTASRAIRDELDALGRSLSGYRIHLIQDQADFIRTAIGEVQQSALIGIVLAVLVLYAFLRRIGVTAVVALAIPVSVVATFNLMYFNNLTLNIMTLGGLALGAGMLVDNAIVVGENIFRHAEAGLPILEAAVRGAGEVGGAITSSTLTTIIVFLPIVYLHGVAGELFKDQAWTVAFSLLSSLVVALAVVPMLFSRFIKPDKGKALEAKSVRFAFYGRVVEGILRKRGLVVLVALALVGIALFCLRFVGSEFLPQQDQDELVVNIALPEGTGLERTEGAVRSIEAMIREAAPGPIERIFSRIGPTGTAQSAAEILEDENNAVIHVAFASASARALEEAAGKLERELAAVPDLDVQFVRRQTTLQATIGAENAPLVVEIKGKDLETLVGLADTVKAELGKLEGLKNVETSFQEGRPQIDIEIDKAQASRYSLRADTIGNQVATILAGSDLGEFEDKGEYLKIMYRNPKVPVSSLKDILLEAPSGLRVPLGEVARLVRTESPREIIRKNQTRVAEVRAQIGGDIPFDRVAARVARAISGIPLPEGYLMSVTGEELLRRESFKNLKFALLLAIVLVYMVLAAQFESLVHPFIILLTIPLAGVGALFLLLVLGMPFNIMSIIGLIMLAGIAVNDSIILVDLINQSRRGGMALEEAIVYAARMRIRPIVITSLTTVLALLPLTIGFGEGASLRAPMAVAVIGGLFSSTALTLAVIPAVYRLLGSRPLTSGARGG